MQHALPHREPSRRTRPSRSLVALIALSALLAGCSSSGDTATSTEGRASGGVSAQDGTVAKDSAPGAQSAAAPAAPGPGASGGRVSGGQAGTSKPAAPAIVVGPKLTKNASLDLRVSNIEAAAAKVRAVAAGLQAQVLSEQIGKGGAGDPVPLQSDKKQSNAIDDLGGFGTLTLAVPADKLDTALDQLSRIGTVLRRNTSSQDVTAQYVDTQSRLKTMRASVGRVRALMAQARDIGQVVALEGELSQREADLESLGSQLSALDKAVERSPVTVSLSTLGSQPVSENGFVAGLRSGWNAFTASAGGLFTAVGGVLPFAVFFALLGAPLVWWLRRRQGLAAALPSQVNAP
jgi:hypothetical protein